MTNMSGIWYGSSHCFSTHLSITNPFHKDGRITLTLRIKIERWYVSLKRFDVNAMNFYNPFKDHINSIRISVNTSSVLDDFLLEHSVTTPENHEPQPISIHPTSHPGHYGRFGFCNSPLRVHCWTTAGKSGLGTLM